MLAGWFKVRFGASEIVTTIMLNYIAIIGTGYLVTGPLIEEAGKFPQTAQISEVGPPIPFPAPHQAAYRLSHCLDRGHCDLCFSVQNQQRICHSRCRP